MSRLAHWMRPTLALAGLIAVLMLFAGCKAEECQQMTKCCAEVSDVPGVGSSCGELAQQTRDPDTCRMILKTVRYMFEERSEEPPGICLPKKKGAESSKLHEPDDVPARWTRAFTGADHV